MIKKFLKILFLFLFLFNQCDDSICEEINENNENDENKDEIISNEYLNTSFNRIENCFRALNIAKCSYEAQKEFHKICKNYLGLNSNKAFSKNLKDIEKFNIKLIESINTFNQVISEDEKFFFDSRVSYILSYEENILNTLKKDELLNASCLSFLISIMMPVQFSEASNLFVMNSENSLIKWQEILSRFKLIFSEIGQAKDQYLYKDFEKNLMKNLFNNEIFKTLKSGCRYTRKNLKKMSKNQYTDIHDSYNIIIRDFIDNDEKGYFEGYLKLDGHLFNWLNSNYFNETINYITNEDILFILMILGRIGSEKNINLFELDDITHLILQKYSSLSREILNYLCKICNIKKIKWKNLNPIMISKVRLESIIQNIALFGSLGKILGSDFLEKYNI